VAVHERVGIDRGVVVSGGAYGRDSTFLVDVLTQYPRRFRGVAVPPDRLSKADIETMDAAGVRGVRFLGSRRPSTHLAPVLPEVARAVEDFGWHVQFYGRGDDIIDQADQLLSLPNQIVLDHFGGIDAAAGTAQPAFRRILAMLDTGRVWVKLSGPMHCSKLDAPYADVTPLAQALAAHAPERLVWGSDWPNITMNGRAKPAEGSLLDLLSLWVPDDAIRRRILVDNPCALYGFDPLTPV